MLEVKHEVSLCSSRDKVWDAIHDPENFGLWFGVAWNAGTTFAVGAPVVGQIAATNVHPGTARKLRPYFGRPIELVVERVDEGRCLSFRWHSFSWEASDLGGDATTQVLFELAEAGNRTALIVTESGFETLAEESRNRARATSAAGWARQLYLLELFLNGARDLRPVRD